MTVSRLGERIHTAATGLQITDLRLPVYGQLRTRDQRLQDRSPLRDRPVDDELDYGISVVDALVVDVLTSTREFTPLSDNTRI